MSKRSHNEGSVYFDNSRNCWTAEGSAGYDETGERKRVVRRRKTKTAAVQALKQIERQIDDGLPTGSAAMTISELLDFTSKPS